MGGGSDSAKQRESQNAAAQLALAQQNAALQKQIYGQISPFASSLLNMGTGAANGQAPAYFQNAILPGLESGFQGARQNLMDFFGKSGQGISGLAAGPFANEQNDEANSMSQAKNQSILQALQLGSSGAGMMQGQQGIFNPSPYFQGTSTADQNVFAMSQNPWMGLLGSLAGSAIGALTGIPMGGGSKSGGSTFNATPVGGMSSGTTTNGGTSWYG